jgi:hypothetical protein
MVALSNAWRNKCHSHFATAAIQEGLHVRRYVTFSSLRRARFWQVSRNLLALGAALFIFAYLSLPSLLDALDTPRDPNQNKCVPRSFDPHDDTRKRPVFGGVKTIRLTNSGALIDRCELTDALEEMVWDRELQGPHDYKSPSDPDAPNLPRLAILYIHGWKHSAADGDSDRINFGKLIDRLNAKYSGRKQVLGIYIGWNASWHMPFLETIHLGVLENLTFWSKKTIADRIAEAAVVTKIVSALGSSRKPERGDQLIAIGHSFGARLLFAGIGQTLIYETQRAHPGSLVGEYKVVKGATDAIILLNPAFEASMYTVFDGITRNEERFSPHQAPLLVSVASEGDDATRKAFPLGQWLGGARSPEEKTTLGNYRRYSTHSLDPIAAGQCGANNTPISERFGAGGLCLTRLRRPIKQTYNPFIVAHTTADVINDHNDVWNARFSDWLLGLVEALEASHEASKIISPPQNQ